MDEPVWKVSTAETARDTATDWNGGLTGMKIVEIQTTL